MLTPNRWATSDSLRPWDRSSTMRARSASRWLEEGEADLCRSSALSSGVISTEATGRAMPQYGTVWRFTTSYFTDRTLGALAEWLASLKVREVVMESTAQYWKPV